jgi:hypothetical protein
MFDDWNWNGSKTFTLNYNVHQRGRLMHIAEPKYRFISLSMLSSEQYK